MKICPTCGASFEDSGRFCPVCGADTSGTTAGPATDSSEPTVSLNPSSPFGSGTSEAPRAGRPQGQPGQDYGSYGRDASGAPYGNPSGPGYNPGYQGQPQGQPGHGAPYPGGRQPYQAVPPYVAPYDHTDEFDGKDISDNKVIAMCIYLLGTVGLFIALLCQKSEYVTFHIRQSLKLTVVHTLIWVCAGVLSFVLSFFGILFGAVTTTSSYYAGSVNPVQMFFSFGIGSLPLIIASFCSIAIFVIRIICFVQICKGKVMEAPLVRSLNFLK